MYFERNKTRYFLSLSSRVTFLCSGDCVRWDSRLQSRLSSEPAPDRAFPHMPPRFCVCCIRRPPTSCASYTHPRHHVRCVCCWSAIDSSASGGEMRDGHIEHTEGAETVCVPGVDISSYGADDYTSSPPLSRPQHTPDPRIELVPERRSAHPLCSRTSCLGSRLVLVYYIDLLYNRFPFRFPDRLCVPQCSLAFNAGVKRATTALSRQLPAFILRYVHLHTPIHARTSLLVRHEASANETQ